MISSVIPEDVRKDTSQEVSLASQMSFVLPFPDPSCLLARSKTRFNGECLHVEGEVSLIEVCNVFDTFVI